MASEATAQISYLTTHAGMDRALGSLSTVVRSWFAQKFTQPTAAQCQAWPAVAAGRNLLLCAPTGTGKTLAAFLPVLSVMIEDAAPGKLRCLYVAPLKALINDVRRTLRRHLREMRTWLGPGARLPRVALRTGDTSQRLRRQLLLEPPDILLTTPESLAILMTVPSACAIFEGVRWMIVDEVHALASAKRGADLSLALERLDALTRGRLQRIGLSATCAPIEEAARFLVGVGRPCSVAQVAHSPALELKIEPLEENAGFLTQLVERIGLELANNRSTLIFTNTRSLAERLGWAMRRRYPEWDTHIAVHHSSIAAASRRWVERRFKHGRLRAVVSSASLELGIDIGAVDGVILIHPPGGVVRLLQRVGRSGHEPARPRRGLVLTAGAAELLEASVTCASTQPPQLEPLKVPDAPLDVLCQHLVGMAAISPYTAEEAFRIVRRAYPYRNLARSDLDDCLSYLSGHGTDGTEWLPPRLAWQDDSFRILDQRTLRILRRNMGTILSDEPRRVLLRLCDENGDREVELGNLDEMYADRLQPGDRFLLDGRCLECRQAGFGDLVVDEVPGRPAVPRWRSEQQLVGSELARRIFLLRVQAAEALRDGGPDALRSLLANDYALMQEAVERLIEFFQQQESVSEIPGAGTFLIEGVRRDGGWEFDIHTPLAHAANDALARVAVFRLARDLGRSGTSLVADLGLALVLRRSTPLSTDEIRKLFDVQGFEDDLGRALADSVTLRERFRRVATVGLMILRQPLGGRRRVGGQDWADRCLFDKVRMVEPNFVFMRQAMKEAREASDGASARDFVEALPRLDMRCRQLPAVSPFAANWPQQLAGPVGQVEGPAEALRNLHESLFGKVAM